MNRAESAAKAISDSMEEDVNIVFEDDVLGVWILLRKKNYLYRIMNPDGTLQNKINAKGVLLVRRDNCPWLKSSYKRIVDAAMNMKSLTEIEDIILEEALALLQRKPDSEKEGQPKLDMLKFVISKSVKDFGGVAEEVSENGTFGAYKTIAKASPELLAKKGFATETEFYESQIAAHAQLARRCCSRGLLIMPGERIPFVVTDEENFASNEHRRLEHVDFFVENTRFLDIDRISYIRKLCTAADTLVNVLPRDETKSFAESKCSCKKNDICTSCKNIRTFDENSFKGRATLLLNQFIKHVKTMTELKNLFRPIIVNESEQTSNEKFLLNVEAEEREIMEKRKRKSLAGAKNSKRQKL